MKPTLQRYFEILSFQRLLFLCVVIHWRLNTYLYLKHERNNYFLGEGFLFNK